MCRISGSVNDSTDWVKTANAHQRNGGPDSHGLVIRDNVAFGHCRLAIQDINTDNSKQPIYYHNKYLLTYNGEIYNYKDFESALPSDTLALYELIYLVGVQKALPQLNGMFAFAVYDSLNQLLHLVVDRFAQKPLYYYHRGNQFYFASFPAALYNLEPSWKINKEALNSYWLLGSVMGEDSIFCGIKKLNASEHLIYDIRENKITIQRYWEPKFQDNTNDIEDLVLDAINKTKLSDVPIHIFLSGGIDSTLVASQYKDGQAIHLDSPERQYAQYVSDKFNIDLKIINPATIKTEQYLTDHSLQSGEPTMAGLIPYTTAKEVSKFGKVAITANGADECFYGYNRITEWAGNNQINNIFRSINYDNKWFSVNMYDSFYKGQQLELDSYIQFDLNKTLDFASMCHGLEVRSPFLDHRLVEMALSIPEKIHRKEGNKTILKRMLRKIGFDDKFINRPKLGFSLHSKPDRLDALVKGAFDWVQQNDFLNIKGLTLSGRDRSYLEMSALGFYYWFKAWQHKIK